MDHSGAGGHMGPPVTYDYRLYDRIWQRVSPELVPYPALRSGEEPAPAAPPAPDAPALPGALPDPCCMGSGAVDDVAVLEAFAAQELAQRHCYLALAGNVCRRDVQRLLRQMAEEKQAAFRQLHAALYLIDGSCRQDEMHVEPVRWRCLADALRSCYHREACDGFNYQRAADGTPDPCLQRLLRQLGEKAFGRAESIMSLLGRIIDQ